MATTDLGFLRELDKAIEEAARLLDLSDLDDLPEEAAEEDYEDIYELRHHCGTCTVAVVMEQVWPVIKAHIDFLEKLTGFDPHPVELEQKACETEDEEDV